MRAWLVPLIALVASIAIVTPSHAQGVDDLTVPAPPDPPAADGPTDAAPTAAAPSKGDMVRASRYKTAGAVLLVFGALGTIMGTGMVIGREDDPDDNRRGVPYEVGIAAAGVTTLFAGVYFTASAYRIESRAKTAVGPMPLHRGMGVAVVGEF